MQLFRGKSRRERRLRAASVLAAVAGCFALFVASQFAPLDRVQDNFSDSLFERQQGSANVVIVRIGDEELERNGRLAAWPRSLHATAIDRLHEAGARVIVYDVLFADPGADDAVLAAAVKRAGTVVLAAAGGGSDDIVVPLPSIAAGARAVAHANLDTDGDGRVRRIPVQTSAGDASLVSLSLAAFYLQFGREAPTDIASGSSSITANSRTIPLEDGAMRVNYVGSTASFPNLSFDQIIAGDFDPAAVNGKIVLIGVTAAGVDRHSAPLLGNAAGIEIHANAIDTLLRASFLRLQPAWVGLLTSFLFIVGCAVVVLRWRVTYAAVATVSVAIGYVVLAAFMFTQGRLIDAVNPPAVLIFTAMVGLVYRVMAERAAHREVADLFGRYVSPQVAGELVRQADLGELRLGGEVREITVLFADIRGFTTLSLDMDPALLVQLLNQRFDVIVANVARHGGIVNKFIGDAVVAFWNAPKDHPDHALAACQAAIAALDELEAQTVEGPPIRFGFGINTGLVLAGNVGSAGRSEYTVMGETVNTSSRFSGAAAGGEIWIGERTRQQLHERIGVDELPPQQLKGMAAPVACYRLHRHEEIARPEPAPLLEAVR